MSIERLAWWRRRASGAPLVQLVQGFREARTAVEQLALAELTRREELTFLSLVTSITSGLVGREIGRCGSAVDIGISGHMIFHAAVVRELRALEGVLWRYGERPTPPPEPQVRAAPWRPRHARPRLPRLTLTT